ncbi:MAG: hypothetical protein H7326_07365 [Bdellovibrionaceae bacterium]|nr:hypothetical protein [Pseudobdellovibrionaceae bacterium]
MGNGRQTHASTGNQHARRDSIFAVCAWSAFNLTSIGKIDSSYRAPAGTNITDYSQDQITKAEWLVSSIDFANSDPGRGRSYFDCVFSKVVGDKRVYEVPYPFEKAIARINEYMGLQNGAESGFKTVLFPMGRSLPRNAALIGQDGYDIDSFFKFPRVVLGVDKEPKVPIALNLKGRFFHEARGMKAMHTQRSFLGWKATSVKRLISELPPRWISAYRTR